MDRRDSTDNELVIDEGDGNGIENGHDEDAHGMNGTTTTTTTQNASHSVHIIEMTESDAAELEPDTVDMVEPAERNTEPEENNGLLQPMPAIPKSKPPKHKSNQNNKPKKTPTSTVTSKTKFKRVQTFKLSTLKSFKSTTLSISARLNEFYKMRLYIMPGNVLSAEMATEYSYAPPMPDLNVDQLMNWPGLTMTLTLRDVTFVRKVVANYSRDIVFGDDQYINVDKSENVTATRRISKTNSSKLGPVISKAMLDTYVAAFEDSLDLVDVSRPRIPEIKSILNKLKRDLKELPNLYLKTSYSFYPNKQKYMRIFDNEKAKNVPKTYLREVINPEVQFSIEKCTFLNESVATWEKELNDYFEKVFITRDKTQLNAIKDMSTKWVSFTCMCNAQFSGALCIYSLNAHLAKHFYDKDWNCIQCNKSIGQFQLAQNGWTHKCSTGGQ